MHTLLYRYQLSRGSGLIWEKERMKVSAFWSHCSLAVWVGELHVQTLCVCKCSALDCCFTQFLGLCIIKSWPVTSVTPSLLPQSFLQWNKSRPSLRPSAVKRAQRGPTVENWWTTWTGTVCVSELHWDALYTFYGARYHRTMRQTFVVAMLSKESVKSAIALCLDSLCGLVNYMHKNSICMCTGLLFTHFLGLGITERWPVPSVIPSLLSRSFLRWNKSSLLLLPFWVKRARRGPMAISWWTTCTSTVCVCEVHWAAFYTFSGAHTAAIVKWCCV